MESTESSWGRGSCRPLPDVWRSLPLIHQASARTLQGRIAFADLMEGNVMTLAIGLIVGCGIGMFLMALAAMAREGKREQIAQPFQFPRSVEREREGI
jgi:hypothetical protein